MRTAVLIAIALFAFGCSGDSQMSKSDEATLKNNLTRGLTKEEMGQMGASKDAVKAPNDKL